MIELHERKSKNIRAFQLRYTFILSKISFLLKYIVFRLNLYYTVRWIMLKERDCL